MSLKMNNSIQRSASPKEILPLSEYPSEDELKLYIEKNKSTLSHVFQCYKYSLSPSLIEYMMIMGWNPLQPILEDSKDQVSKAICNVPALILLSFDSGKFLPVLKNCNFSILIQNPGGGDMLSLIDCVLDMLDRETISISSTVDMLESLISHSRMIPHCNSKRLERTIKQFRLYPEELKRLELNDQKGQEEVKKQLQTARGVMHTKCHASRLCELLHFNRDIDSDLYKFICSTMDIERFHAEYFYQAYLFMNSRRKLYQILHSAPPLTIIN